MATGSSIGVVPFVLGAVRQSGVGFRSAGRLISGMCRTANSSPPRSGYAACGKYSWMRPPSMS